MTVFSMTVSLARQIRSKEIEVEQALTSGQIPSQVARRFACDCAQRALMRERQEGREPDQRSWQVLWVMHRWLTRHSTDKDREEAWEAAREASWPSGDTAASSRWKVRYSPDSVAWKKAWKMARAAARAAAWAGARVSPCSAARAAARAAADATPNASSLDEERQWQRLRLADLLDEFHSQQQHALGWFSTETEEGIY